MPLLLAVALQIVGVALAAACLGMWVSPYAAGLLVAAVVFYAGLEGEKR